MIGNADIYHTVLKVVDCLSSVALDPFNLEGVIVAVIGLVFDESFSQRWLQVSLAAPLGG